MRVIREPVPRVLKRPRHPEVNQERATTLEPNNQILATAIELLDPLTAKLGRDDDRIEGASEARVRDLDVREGPAQERGLERTADRLDLGELRHGLRLVQRPRL